MEETTEKGHCKRIDLPNAAHHPGSPVHRVYHSHRVEEFQAQGPSLRARLWCCHLEVGGLLPWGQAAPAEETGRVMAGGSKQTRSKVRGWG